MSVEVYNTFMVCQDCIMFVANGDGPEYLVLERDGDAKYEERLAEIVAGVERLQALCAGGHLVATSDEATDDEFSWRPCECCRSKLGGSRHQTTLLCSKVTKNMRRNGRGAPADYAAAGELKLYIDNDRATYEAGRMYRAALEKRMVKGTFNLALAAKGFGWIVEEGAKRYTKEFGGTWHSMFSPATRDVVAKEMAQEWYEEYRVQHPTKNARYTQSLPSGYTVYEQRGRLGEDPRYHWNWKTADGDVGVGYRTERLARAAAVESQEYLKRIGAHLASLRGRASTPNRKRTSRRNGRWKVWTGPTQVRAVAKAFEAFPGVSDVLEGTEHVHFTYDGDPKDLTKRGVPALVRAYAIGTSDTGIRPTRNKRTSRRGRRTSRRAA